MFTCCTENSWKAHRIKETLLTPDKKPATTRPHSNARAGEAQLTSSANVRHVLLCVELQTTYCSSLWINNMSVHNAKLHLFSLFCPFRVGILSFLVRIIHRTCVFAVGFRLVQADLFLCESEEPLASVIGLLTSARSPLPFLWSSRPTLASETKAWQKMTKISRKPHIDTETLSPLNAFVRIEIRLWACLGHRTNGITWLIWGPN